MKHAVYTTLAGSLMLAACTGNPSPRVVRQQIATLGEASLITDDIQVERITTELGNRAIAEATVRLAFQFEQNSTGEWEIVAARLGDRQWIEVDQLIGAIERQRADATSEALGKLAAGIRTYLDQTGALPDIGPAGYVSDALHPVYMTELIRDDAWGTRIRYQVDEGNWELRSAGPDGMMETADDIVAND